MILYFSGTGNSKYAAQRIADGLGDTLCSMNERIKAGDTSPVETGSRLVIVTPTYAWRIPRLVRDWLLRTELTGSTQVWFVMTGGSEIGSADKYNRALCREKGVPFVLDASQSAGMLSVDMDALGAAFIAMPGHKGLYGPQGTGLLLCGAEPEPLLRGGTGSQSILQEMPEDLPDRLEAGTHNMPGIAGLLEGLRFVEQQGGGRIAGHERHLTRHMAALLRDIPGAEVFYTPEDGAQTGVLSFRLDGWDCEALGEALAAQGAAVRAGLHCAPLAHRTAGTLETGTVRCSFSAFNTTAQVEHFAHILRQIVR